MEHFKILLTCGVAMILAFAVALRLGEPSPPSPLVTILTDQALWGNDFPAALASLQRWNQIGERAVAVFPDQVVGTTPYKTGEDAQRSASQLARAMGEPQPQPQPTFADLLRGLRQQPSPFMVEAVPFHDDDSFRVAWSAPTLQFLVPSLTVKEVEARVGPPEQITTQLVQSERDRRPIVLTLHRYAGGAVIFVETDWAPQPGVVDRVIFDVPAVTAVLFKEPR